MIEILGLWLAFMFGVWIGTFTTTKSNQKLLRESDTRCEFCLGEYRFAKTIQKAFEISEEK